MCCRTRLLLSSCLLQLLRCQKGSHKQRVWPCTTDSLSYTIYVVATFSLLAASCHAERASQTAGPPADHAPSTSAACMVMGSVRG